MSTGVELGRGFVDPLGHILRERDRESTCSSYSIPIPSDEHACHTCDYSDERVGGDRVLISEQYKFNMTVG